MKVAVIGGGIFGCTAAIHCARAGHEAHLFEATNDILMAASGINQFRLHAGYHYPRSPETVQECQEGLESFRQEYESSVLDDGHQFYGIARFDSKVTPAAYERFMKDHGLKYERRALYLDPRKVRANFRVPEARIDIGALRGDVASKLINERVILHFGERASIKLRDEFDKIIIATYASTNEVAIELECAIEPLQFEVVEKPVIALPLIFKNIGFVIMDGPFCSIDPYGQTGAHLMGHVELAIHASNVGLEPQVPDELAGYLNRGIVAGAPESRWEQFKAAGTEFFPSLKSAKCKGSMWTVRAVLPDTDETDERPTLVDELDDQVLRIFSGKIGTAVVAAKKAVAILDKTRADQTVAA